MPWFRRNRRLRFDNRSFWNDRYRTDPDLGSGIGSRGELAEYKRGLVIHTWQRAQGTTLLDVGFGDLHVVDPNAFPSYAGVDVSDVAVARAQKRYPQHTFTNTDFASETEPDVGSADMVLCLDVLIHQLDAAGYRRMVRRLVARTHVIGLISGYEDRPSGDFASDITAFHEPLSRTLAEAGAVEIVKVGEYRGLDAFEFRQATDVRQQARDRTGL